MSLCTLTPIVFDSRNYSFSLSEPLSHWISFYYFTKACMISALTRVIDNHTDLAVGAVLLLVTAVLALASLSVAPQHLPNTVLEMQNKTGTKWIKKDISTSGALHPVPAAP